MNGKAAKYAFILTSALLLAIMLCQTRNAGISCDEVLHYDHSVTVYNYFSTHGEDQSALNTPVSHLKYYGQSYDNLVTILIKWFNIEDVYGFRHIMSAIAGWLTALITALFAVWLAGFGPGIIVLLLYAVSPTFLGHAQNNLKDIPFALGYISSLYFTLRLILSSEKFKLTDILLLTLSIGFTISIRAGGLILICYMFLFYFINLFRKYLKYGRPDPVPEIRNLVILFLISGSAYFLSILIWPYALHDPLRNVFRSYKIMAHFPSTFRQIFEGKTDWSDFMPWYYLLKSMAITIPFVVFSGFLFLYKHFKAGRTLIVSLILFTLLFPVIFVIFTKSNLYSAWRQFLFLYPVIILISATSMWYLLESLKNRYLRWGLILCLVLLSIHPVQFMIKNHPYEYLYYNQLTGGLKGAYGNYETDYYYTSLTEASEWLKDYLDEKNYDSVIIKATYSVEWQFRERPEISTSYFRYEERSMYDWDYAIATNRYIPVFQLSNKVWPPSDAIHTIYVDEIPICVVTERKSKAGFYGYVALEQGNNQEAIIYFTEALQSDANDEMIFYNFARTLNNVGRHQEADSILRKSLELNPEFEPALMYTGNIARDRGNKEEAIVYYERLISVNRKYFRAYVELSYLLAEKDLQSARKLLRSCLTINPGYKPAVIALADTYRKTDPEIAVKYDKLAATLKDD